MVDKSSPFFDILVDDNVSCLTALFESQDMPVPDDIRKIAEELAIAHLKRVEAFNETPEGKAWWKRVMDDATRCEVDPNNIPRIKVRKPGEIKAVIVGANGAITPWPIKKEVEP